MLNSQTTGKTTSVLQSSTVVAPTPLPRPLFTGKVQEEYGQSLPRHLRTCLSKHQSLPPGLPSALHTYSSTKPIPAAFPAKNSFFTPVPKLSLHLEHPLSSSLFMLFQVLLQVPFPGLYSIYDTHCLDARVPAPLSLMIPLPCGLFLPP